MRWIFDFVSPYAYLQSTRLGELQSIEPVQAVPVLLAGLLNHWGQLGPAELAPKRQWTYEHVTWLAHRDGIALKMPARHPFNSLPLLRLAASQNNALAAVTRIFRWVWAEGNTPDDTKALDALCGEFGLGMADLKAGALKDAIRNNTDKAIAGNVFGVPTIHFQGQNFWGDDATAMVIARARSGDDESAYPHRAIAQVAATPVGATRQKPAASAPAVNSPAHSLEPRIPFQPMDLAEPAELVAAVRKRRGGDFIELDRMLLHSPPLTEGWNYYLGTIRTRLSLSPKLGELVISMVAVLNRADFEFGQHAPLFVAAGGTEAQVSALQQQGAQVAASPLFAPQEQAALQLCVEMTRDVQVSDLTFARCREFMEPRVVVELVATIATYNMVSRFLVALNVHAQPATSRS